ncbi:MAG: ATP-dependent Clp protease adaptor ClpS [Myxococcota bacterium]
MARRHNCIAEPVYTSLSGGSGRRVAAALQKQFELDHDAALAVTVAAHCSGFAAVGPYALSEAEDHIEAATEATFKAGHALCLSLEEPNIEDWMLTRQGLLPPETPRASSWD